MSSWVNELFRAALILVSALAVGLLSGYTSLSLFLGFVGYLLFHIRNFFRLWSWLRDGGRPEPPESQGIWQEIFDGLYRIKQRDRESKKRLGRELKRFRKSTRALPDGLLLIDDADRIGWMNPAAASLLGLNAKSDRGNRIHNLVRHPRFVAYMASENYGHAIEVPTPNSDGGTLEIALMPTDEGQRLVWVRDVTHVKRMDQVRQDFVANASHELRTPLTVIAGYLDSLQDCEQLPESVKPAMSAMRTQADRMQQIIRDLLVLIRLEANPPDRRDEPVRIDEMLGEIAGQIRHQSDDEIQVVVEVDSNIDLIGNRGEMFSALNNLAVNAMNYTPGQGKIEIHWAATNSGAKFSVIDNGVGIAAEHIARLTERFYRVGDGRGRYPHGTGLGLAIVKHVLLRHQSALEISSTPGSGSRFSCHFPASRLIHRDAPKLKAVG